MSATTTAVVIGGCAIGTFLIKAVGPVAFGGRELPDWFLGVVVLLAPALLAALVVTHTLAEDDSWQASEETVGVLAAALVVWRTGSIIACVVVAAAVTAGLRAL